MNTGLKQRIVELARATPNVEVCGLLYQTTETVELYPCANVTRDEEGPQRAFELDPVDYMAADERGNVIGVYHGHAADGTTAFSEGDLDMARELELPFYLYCNADGSWHSYVPPGYIVPTAGVPFAWGFADCYETVRIYYRQQRGVYLPDYERDESFEHSPADAITRHIEEEGFRHVPVEELAIGDVLLFTTPGSSGAHHLGVLVGPSQMLHHQRGGLSRVDPLDGHWMTRLVGGLRYIGKPPAS